jgi:hypothetical protein
MKNKNKMKRQGVVEERCTRIDEGTRDNEYNEIEYNQVKLIK